MTTVTKEMIGAAHDVTLESGDGRSAMKTCATCNASHKNTVERVLRCMGCVAKPSGNSNWRPLVPNAKVGAGDTATEGHNKTIYSNHELRDL
jgi:hypothetical protein